LYSSVFLKLTARLLVRVLLPVLLLVTACTPPAYCYPLVCVFLPVLLLVTAVLSSLLLSSCSRASAATTTTTTTTTSSSSSSSSSNCCTPPAYCYPLVCVLLLTRNWSEQILSLLLIQQRNVHGPTVNTYHVIDIQPVYWRVGRIYRKHSFLYCFVLDRVYRAVAWQRIDQIH
jgi:hypothetical protein